LFAILALLPFIYIIAGSFATDIELKTRAFFLFPHKPSLAAYRFILSKDPIVRGLINSIVITVLGTIINLCFTLTMAYSLSKKYFAGRNFFMKLIIFSMLFGGGMIPTYLLIKSLKLLDSYFALWLPIAINPFNLIVVKSFFEQIPSELEESAKLDGCTDLHIFAYIVLPLSMPVVATFALFYAVGHWNSYFSALIYINKSVLWPIQIILREMVILSTGMAQDASINDPNFVPPPDQAIKMAVIVIATIPILLFYPYIQKHFTKGVLLGSIKQ
jgi:putative aldouronate transport system permease protein